MQIGGKQLYPFWAAYGQKGEGPSEIACAHLWSYTGTELFQVCSAVSTTL